MQNLLDNDQDVLIESSSDNFYQDIFHEKSEAEYTNAIALVQKRVSGFLENTKIPFSGITPEEIKNKVEAVNLDLPLKNYERLWDEIDELYVNHATAFHLPEYIAHLNCPVVIPALAADVLISAINSSQDTYDQSAGGTFIERKLIAWTGQQIGYGKDCDGIFTAGGSQSNLMGLLLARDYFALKYLNWNIKLNGCPPDSSKFRIFVSEKSHFSNQKNAAILGLGEQSIIQVVTDNRYRMDAERLKEAIIEEKKKGNIPVAIVATAGTTDFGNIDPLSDIAILAKEHELWLHVDAAYGCGLLLTDKYKSLLNGIEQADSVTIDYHKSFFQPICSSAFMVRNKQHLHIIKHHADYLNPKEQDYDELPAQINKSLLQSTRRFDALKLWCTLRYMGRTKLGQFTETIIETARETVEILDSDKDFELLTDSDLSVLVFRYNPSGWQGDCCKMNQYIKKKMFFSGEVLVASTKVNDTFYLKFTILNPLTTIAHINNILSIIKKHGNEYILS